jgi:hypothetical protein
MKHNKKMNPLPTRAKAFEKWEAIDSDSLSDALEVADDWAENMFDNLKRI